ncbi:MAG: amino acid permease, partial [Gammaproteobacteria bacterium]
MSAEPVSLKRSLSLLDLSLYGLGTILGAGIYVLIGAVAARSGVHMPLAFLVAALVAAPTALAYAELGARYPVSAGEAKYIDAAFDRRPLTLAVGLAVVAVGIISAAT